MGEGWGGVGWGGEWGGVGWASAEVVEVAKRRAGAHVGGVAVGKAGEGEVGVVGARGGGVVCMLACRPGGGGKGRGGEGWGGRGGGGRARRWWRWRRGGQERTWEG